MSVPDQSDQYTPKMRRLCLLAVLIAAIRAEERCCDEAVGCFNDDPPFDHLPLPECPPSLRPAIQLYTRNNPRTGQVVTRTTIPPSFDGNKRTAVLIHGWLGSRDSPWLEDMRDKILGRVDWNVITVGWSEGSQDLWYPQAASNTRSVGTEVGLTVENLVNNGGASRTDIWCMGHSLGSHTCGHAGKKYKWGRLTGMDPAGPLFDTYDIRCGLQPSDGDYVDVIHTHGKGGVILDLGTLRPLGDVDFYPNGGGVQPGCIINYNDASPVCSHYRAVDYMEESFQRPGCTFQAKSKCTDQNNIPGSCTPCQGACQAIGIEGENFSQRGLFYLETNSEEPFCKG